MANYTPPASFSTSHATTTTSQAPSTSAPPPEISPATLDTLPILAAILSRLQTGASSSTTTTTTALPLGSPHVSQSQTLQAASTSSPFASAAAHKDLHTGPLTTKDLPAATDDLKSGLKRARALVAQLPDMERGVEEQEGEIRELEARIAEQRGVLLGLKAMGGGGVVET